MTHLCTAWRIPGGRWWRPRAQAARVSLVSLLSWSQQTITRRQNTLLLPSSGWSLPVPGPSVDHLRTSCQRLSHTCCSMSWDGWQHHWPCAQHRASSLPITLPVTKKQARNGGWRSSSRMWVGPQSCVCVIWDRCWMCLLKNRHIRYKQLKLGHRMFWNRSYLMYCCKINKTSLAMAVLLLLRSFTFVSWIFFFFIILLPISSYHHFIYRGHENQKCFLFYYSNQIWLLDHTIDWLQLYKLFCSQPYRTS